MTSPSAQILHRAAEVLGGLVGTHPHLAPELGPMCGALGMLACEIDGAVASQLEQVKGLQDLLTRALACRPPPDGLQLGEALQFAPASPGEYRFDVLEQQLVRLRRALIDVQAWAEAGEGAQQQILLREIWAYLDRQAKHAGRLVPSMW